MTKQTITLLIFALLLFGCDSGKFTKVQNDKLQKELDDCKKTVADLLNTPQQRLSEAQKLVAIKDYSAATSHFQELIDKFPATDEAKISKESLSGIKFLQLQQKEAEEKKKTLGFKTLTESNKVKVGDVQVSFSNVSTVVQWTFDSYGDEWRLRGAERGNKYLVAKVSIKAESKNPDLPPISAYKILDGKLSLLGTLRYEFSRWRDYGSYLGNYSDYGNDFAHTSTIGFSSGLQISDKDIDDEALFVVVKKTNCFLRSSNGYGTPPVRYEEGTCNMKQTLNVDDFENDYILIKIFNRTKL
jgi:hypothetical protein